MLNNEETRAGAKAAMDLFRNFESIAEGRVGVTLDEYWQGKKVAVESMLAVAGNQNEFVTGFLAAIAEYILEAHEDGLVDHTWKPEAAMTEAEKASSRFEFDAAITHL